MRDRSKLSRRDLCLSLLPAAALLSVEAPVPTSNPICGLAPPVTLFAGLDRLIKTYAGYLRSADNTHLEWIDGFRMPIQLFPAQRSMAAKVREPDLAAQVTQVYPKHKCALPTNSECDPGRVRYLPYFARMYGDGAEQVERNLVDVRWPTAAPLGSIRVSKINGAAAHLARVADELNALPKSFHKYFDRPGGGYLRREIAGTSRLSGHSFGIAIDLNLAYRDYWRTGLESSESADEDAEFWERPPRSRIPFEIVEIFERHGFIWGGKWYHFDTPHFEFRPELL